MAGAVTMIRGTADGMVAGTAVGMILGFTARPAIGATVHPSVSAGVGVVSMPATGARLGAGVEAIGVAIGDITIITIPVTTRLQVDIIQTDVPLIEIIALMRVAEVPVIQVGGAVALLP